MSAHTQDSPDASNDSPHAIQPRVRWSQFTDAPLAGLALAREAGRILAWDDAHTLYLIDLAGNRLAVTRTPVPLNSAAICDSGAHVVVVTQEGDIWWLGGNLQGRVRAGGTRRVIGMAISAHGDYVAVGASDNHTRVYDWHGRLVTNLLTNRPLKHLAFLVGNPYLVGAADYGLAGCYEMDGRPRWQDSLWSSAGHLSASGEGYAILISCFGHGLQRYGLDGTNEGAYHLGGGVLRAAIDYDGKTFAAVTLEGDVLLLNAAGFVLWRQSLPKPAKEVLLDATGRYLVYGQETGEITLVDLAPRAEPVVLRRSADIDPAAEKAAMEAAAAVLLEPATPASAPSPPSVGGRQPREPSWRIAAFDSESQAETAVLALVQDPMRIVTFSSRKRVEVFDERGERLHSSDPMLGVGRYVAADGEVVAAATDREIAVYDVPANASAKFHTRFVQISHLLVDVAAGEIVLVEERDRFSRYDLTGRRRSARETDSPIEALAIGADRVTALTTEDGRLTVIDGDGRVVGEYRTKPAEPLALARLGPIWVTLAGKSQRARGHELDGKVIWETGLPTEAWRLVRAGNRVVARAATGRSYMLDAAGRLLLDSSELPYDAVVFLDRAGEPTALYWRAGNLMVTDLVGRVVWRYLSPEPPGPVAAGPAGVACTLGRELAFFAW